eukprot:8380190-Lingulodinium_polyedra.AAC.1
MPQISSKSSSPAAFRFLPEPGSVSLSWPGAVSGPSAATALAWNLDLPTAKKSSTSKAETSVSELA